MIVKFIAVICLLLFIPKLEIVKKGDKDDDNDQDDSRSRLLTCKILPYFIIYANGKTSSIILCFFLFSWLESRKTEHSYRLGYDIHWRIRNQIKEIYR